MSGAAACVTAAVWAAGLCALGVGSALPAVLPRDREDFGAGLASGIAVGMFVTAAWYVSAVCGAA